MAFVPMLILCGILSRSNAFISRRIAPRSGLEASRYGFASTADSLKGTAAAAANDRGYKGSHKEVSILSWNINGLRSYMKHDPSLHILRGLVQKRKPDYICLQETKLQEHHTDDVEEVLRSSLDCRSIIWSSSRGRKGYSGTALLIMHSAFPASAAAAVTFDLGVKEMDDEGRLICLRTKDFALINVYSPNSGASLARLGDRVSVWDVALRARMDGLATSGAAGLTGADKPPGPPFPVIVAGDLNVAHERIDFYQSGTACLKQAGLTPEERESFSSTILKADFIDSFRHTYPTERRYSYFSARQKPSSHSFKRGLRIDYVLSNVGPESISKERPPYIEDEVWLPYSDHSPIGATYLIPSV